MRIPDQITKCVGFACATFAPVNEIVPKGTVCLVGRESDQSVGYFVTAKHVVEEISTQSADGKLHISLNKRFLSSPTDPIRHLIETNTTDWYVHPDDKSIDLAILPFSPCDLWTSDIKMFDLVGAASKDRMAQEGIGIGDETVSVGLFAKIPGKSRNRPIVRVGNIACIPEEPIISKWTNYGPMDAYLIETRSLGGLSGSPVFVQSGPIKTNILERTKYEVSNLPGGTIYLLGITHGHWDIPPVPESTLLPDLSMTKINSGIAVVTPVCKLLEMLEHPELKKRHAELQCDRDSGAVPG
jgi:hypothetical protein